MTLFEGSESVLHDAANKKNEFAMYSERAQDPYSMPDRCRLACQSQLRAFEEGFKNGAKPTCVGDDLKKTFDCLNSVETGDGKSCQFHNWATSFRHICGEEDDGKDVLANTTNTLNTTARMMDDDVDDDGGDDSHNVLLEEPLLVSNNSETADQRRLGVGVSMDNGLWGNMNTPSCESTFMIPMPANVVVMLNNWLPDFSLPGGGKFKSYLPDQWKHTKTYWKAGTEAQAKSAGKEYWNFAADYEDEDYNYEWKQKWKRICIKIKMGGRFVPKCVWAKDKKVWELSVPTWKKFKKGSITWPWCMSLSATGDHPKEWIYPSNWNNPWKAVKTTVETAQKYLMDEIAREEQQKAADATVAKEIADKEKGMASGMTSNEYDMDKAMKEGRIGEDDDDKKKKVGAAPKSRFRQDVESKGVSDSYSCQNTNAACLVPVMRATKSQIRACNWCKTKEFFDKVLMWLKPLMTLVGKGVLGIVKKLSKLAIGHVGMDLKANIDNNYELSFTVMWGTSKNPYAKWDPERFYLQMEIRACINLDVIFPVIKPPICVDACFSGTLTLVTGSSCPGIPTIIVGKATIEINVELKITLVIEYSFALASITLGIEFGVDRHTPRWCWWYHNPKWGRNHSWWQFRRRRVKKCQWGKEVCAVYVKGWVCIRVWIAKVIFELVWWMAYGYTDIFLYFKVETIWSLYWEWELIWGKKICTIDR